MEMTQLFNVAGQSESVWHFLATMPVLLQFVKRSIAFDSFIV